MLTVNGRPADANETVLTTTAWGIRTVDDAPTMTVEVGLGATEDQVTVGT
jgi:hypothetical protein